MSGWTFLTNHSQVLLCIASNPRMTAREIALSIGITERAVQRIVADLEEANYITRLRDGRQNSYTIHENQPMRHPAQNGYLISELLVLLAQSEQA